MITEYAKAKALREAANDLEGKLGIEGTPRDLWEFRQWLRDRANRIEEDYERRES